MNISNVYNGQNIHFNDTLSVKGYYRLDKDESKKEKFYLLQITDSFSDSLIFNEIIGNSGTEGYFEKKYINKLQDSTRLNLKIYKSDVDNFPGVRYQTIVLFSLP